LSRTRCRAQHNFFLKKDCGSLLFCYVRGFPLNEVRVAEIFKHPNLPDYFIAAHEVTSAETARSFVPEYEEAKVVTFPNLKLDIDHQFWASLDTDKHPSLKKFVAYLDATDQCAPERQVRQLVKHGLNVDLATAVFDQFRRLLRDLLPLYRAVFHGYHFDEDRKKVVWRLNTIMNENMHVDAYKEENENHFARMFINLDLHPRIWQTSWPIDCMISRLGNKITAKSLEGKSRGDIWMDVTNATFGNSVKQWWDDEPRHVAYFDPGDIWIVDSRQISHQIFYGRRALSIDFSMPKRAMRNPGRHYLQIADQFRSNLLSDEYA
jgi:hypothetical protein